jgi:hypothetical protein
MRLWWKRGILPSNSFDQMRREYDERPERWQQGDTGQAVSSWIDEWEGLDLGEVDEVSIDPVEEPEVNHADELEGAPDQPD